MRPSRLAAVTLALALTPLPAARAGIYFPNQAAQPAPTFAELRQDLGAWSVVEDARWPGNRELRAGEPRAFFLRRVPGLEEQRREGVLAPLDQIELGACYVYLGRWEPAQETLRAVVGRLAADDPARFLALHNLAAAYARDPSVPPHNLALAVQYQKQALRAWPDAWPTWVPAAWLHYRRAEQMQLRLWEHRLQLAQAGKTEASLDSLAGTLFPDFRFVGRTGHWEPDSLAPEMRALLPNDALEQVWQLLRWSPGDTELLWVLAELLNVSGRADLSLDLLTQMSDTGQLTRPEMREHRKRLLEGGELLKQLNAGARFRTPEMAKPSDLRQLLLALQTQLPGAPVAGAVAQTLGGTVAYLAELAQEGAPLAVAAPPGDTTEPPPPPLPSVLPDWRPILVGFAVGFLVATLLGLQFRQWRRRPAPPAVAPVGADDRLPPQGAGAGRSEHVQPS